MYISGSIFATVSTVSSLGDDVIRFVEVRAGDNHFIGFKSNLDCSLHDGDLCASGNCSSYLSNGVRHWRLYGRIYCSQACYATWVSARQTENLTSKLLPRPEKHLLNSGALLSWLIMSICLGECQGSITWCSFNFYTARYNSESHSMQIPEGAYNLGEQDDSK